jgi:hypothetical protein
MDLTPLIAELKKPEYQGKTDQEAANIINAKTEIVRRPVYSTVLKEYAIKEGFYADIEEGCIGQDTIKRKLCLNIKAWIDDTGGRLQVVNMDDPVLVDMMSGLLQSRIITEDQAKVMNSMATFISRWIDEVGLGEVGIGYVYLARR